MVAAAPSSVFTYDATISACEKPEQQALGLWADSWSVHLLPNVFTTMRQSVPVRILSDKHWSLGRVVMRKIQMPGQLHKVGILALGSFQHA